ncbi:MAG: hypothetical protein ACT4O2_03555 [Beijerinckiaceae bacterium]
MPDFVIRLTADIIGEPGRNTRTALPAEAIRKQLVEPGPINRLGEPRQLVLHRALHVDDLNVDDLIKARPDNS